MDVFNDYAFVVSGRKRLEVVKSLFEPRTPTELSKLLKVHANVITRIMADLQKRGLVELHSLPRKKKVYRLTSKGELARQVLDNLIEPRSYTDLVKYLKTHRNVIMSLLKCLLKTGFVTCLRTRGPARKFVQLTKRGDNVRKKLEDESF